MSGRTLRIACALIVAAGLCGCSEEEEFLGSTATLTVVNEGAGYVDGTIDADRRYTYDVEPGSQERYSLAVGEGILTYTQVIIVANIHANADHGSAIIATDTENIRMSEGKSYEYVIPYGARSGVLRERTDRPSSSITAP